MGERVLRGLQRAAGTDEYVRVTRSNDGADVLYGFVVRARPGWTLIAECSAMRLDGFEAVRTADVVEVRRLGPDDPAVRWLRLHGEWPPAGPRTRVRLRGVRGVIESAAERYPLVGVHREKHRTLNIGRPVGFRAKTFGLWEIDPRAKWRRAPIRFRMKDISRISFGDHYAHVLGEIAPPPPATPRHAPGP